MRGEEHGLMRRGEIGRDWLVSLSKSGGSDIDLELTMLQHPVYEAFRKSKGKNLKEPRFH